MTTESLAEQIDHRIQAREFETWKDEHLLAPPELPPNSPAARAASEQEAKRQERVAAAKAEEERQQRERRANQERLRRQWEARAPERARAAAKLAKLRPHLGQLEDECRGLQEKLGELEDIANERRP